MSNGTGRKLISIDPERRRNDARRKSAPIESVALEGFVAVDLQHKPQAVEIKPVVETLSEKRLANWAKTVLNHGGDSSGVCAFWAKSYIALRNKEHERIALELQLVDPQSPLCSIDADLLDGWLVEAAVRAMTNFDEKQAIRYRYVWNYPDHWIRSKLGIRQNALPLVIARGKNNLRSLLEKLDTPDRIRSNATDRTCFTTFHAGTDPRLEAIAVPVGTLEPLESWSDEFQRLLPQNPEALIDE
ncbi:MAG: hypothetical protein P4L87_11680 [Formivibrio sp.]|nr:hypothetical protein [Formivibrio sp.]